MTSISYESVAKMTLDELKKHYGQERPKGVRFEGVNHVAFVCSDMARTIWFWCEILGMRLLKTIALPDGGQHFFIEGGRGSSVAYFYFPDAPPPMKGVSSVNLEEMLKTGKFSTAHGSVNHVAFNVPREKLHEYRDRVKQAHLGFVTPILYHSDKDTSGYSPSRDEHTMWESFYFEVSPVEFVFRLAHSKR